MHRSTNQHSARVAGLVCRYEGASQWASVWPMGPWTLSPAVFGLPCPACRMDTLKAMGCCHIYSQRDYTLEGEGGGDGGIGALASKNKMAANFDPMHCPPSPIMARQAPRQMVGGLATYIQAVSRAAALTLQERAYGRFNMHCPASLMPNS